MAKLKLIVGNKERIVDDIQIRISGGCPGVSLVNNGSDDLYDIGFRVDEIAEHGLKIIPMEEPHAAAQGLVPVVEMSGQSMVEKGQVHQLRADDTVDYHA